MTDKGDRIFLAHASEDKPRVRELYEQLKDRGYSPWLDEFDLVPGQNWTIEIPKVIGEARLFLACLSKHSVGKVGYVQNEFRRALATLGEKPQELIYLIPVRLDECEVPDVQIPDLGLSLSSLHWVNLYEDGGFEKLVSAIDTTLPNSSVETGRLSVDGDVESRSNWKRHLLLVGITLLILLIVIVWRELTSEPLAVVVREPEKPAEEPLAVAVQEPEKPAEGPFAVRVEPEESAAELWKLDGSSSAWADEIATGLRSKIGDLSDIEVNTPGGDTVKIRVGNSDLFYSGGITISDNGKRVLRIIGDALESVDDTRIRVEGHTDDRPVSRESKFANNWELSFARAQSVLARLRTNIGIPREMLSIAGAGDKLPIASNNSAAGREQNRRIEIVLYPTAADGISTWAKEISATLDEEIGLAGIEVNTPGGDMVNIRVGTNNLFHLGSADLTDHGELILWTIGDALELIDDTRIWIEGHTDDISPGSRLRERFPDNWALSFDRAESVLTHLRTNVGVSPEKLSIVGASDKLPIASNDSAAGREQNRRVEIFLTPMM